MMRKNLKCFAFLSNHAMKGRAHFPLRNRKRNQGIGSTGKPVAFNCLWVICCISLMEQHSELSGESKVTQVETQFFA